MIGYPSRLIATQIITILLKKPGLCAEALRQRVSKDNRVNVTIQAIYKDLRRLQQQQVVFKAESRFFLSLPWLLEMRTEIEDGVSTYSNLNILKNFLPLEGKSQSWRFSDIHAMDRLGVNLMISMLRQSGDKQLYHWEPFPWHALFHTELADPFLKEFRRSGYHAYGILGVQSPVCNRLIQAQKPLGHTWLVGVPSFPYRENTAITVKPPYILSVRYPKEAVSAFQHIFSQKHPTPSSITRPFHHLLHQNLSYCVTLHNNEKRAAAITRHFSTIFNRA